MELDITEPQWLIAIGAPSRVEVYRCPVVREDDSSYVPVREYIDRHGLVLAALETFTDAGWMFGRFEMSVFVPPSVRNGVLAGTETSTPWYPVP
ncbi:hypothetical protein [Mycobacteroides abscessus]|uniref:hypothetical protein n=1 Tax=Mycobacteroides abscessus TaxID=36809 RepID=UPI0002683398|nr:hypothetical protein [Mycobacteroides abscessus]EIT89309.1 hypothetical protein MA4S0303_3107 [Mycobacteroides abscessus 4S-0303]EIT91301.1 hypothetical protein MA4S0726RB_2630 [Mycobacteroides abscessus 4S-0726-RB]EIT94850.1 hypothetical protein MA4S0726RA_3040 [Mycobacteroides abscessus 4S-0726-RA]EIV08958.1 hypothetical protein MA4S0206_3124 [Mycobacteroides abscessus 4S-0206]EIV47985.1 hypothetical protein MA4S0116R_3082 [Mycobacteroides abscessus 4S-0116-R]